MLLVLTCVDHAATISRMSECEYEVLFDDEHLLAINKPAAWETVVKGGTGGRCLTSQLRRWLDLPALEPAHRLDRDTTGVQLFGKDRETVSRLHGMFRERRVRKEYLALCLGIPPNAGGVIRRRLSKWGGGRRAVRVIKGRGGLEAETVYERLAVNDPRLAEVACSLLLLKPHHGRTHQVRVHASALGYPVLGDDQYGDRGVNKQVRQATGLRRQALHAWKISFGHPWTAALVCVEAPVMPDMVCACEYYLPEWRKYL